MFWTFVVGNEIAVHLQKENYTHLGFTFPNDQYSSFTFFYIFITIIKDLLQGKKR